MTQNKQKIHIFGNPLLDFDSLPIKMMPELQKSFPNFEFIYQDPNDNLHPENNGLIIIDSVEGIKDIRILTNIEQIEDSPKYSMHDLDLGFTLKLLKKIGTLDRVTIYCVPMNGNEVEILAKLKELLSSTQ